MKVKADDRPRYKMSEVGSNSIHEGAEKNGSQVLLSAVPQCPYPQELRPQRLTSQG